MTLSSVKIAVKAVLPPFAVRWVQNYRLRRDMEKSRGVNRSEIFSEIYQRRLWGGERGVYSSGTGSKDDVNASYVALVRALIISEGVRSIADLGCGDFRVGRQIISPGVTYVGCDVVPKVVESNVAAFATDSVAFKVADIVTDPLPDAGLGIIRQVFQHLPNADIARVLQKARKYPLLLVTDEQVRGDEAKSNADILAFHGTRRAFGQGLKLERSPFGEKIQVLLEHSPGSDYERGSRTYLRTVLIRNRRP